MKGTQLDTGFYKYGLFHKPWTIVVRTNKLLRKWLIWAVILCSSALALMMLVCIAYPSDIDAMLTSHPFLFGILAIPWVFLRMVAAVAAGGGKNDHKYTGSSNSGGHFTYVVGHGWGYTLW